MNNNILLSIAISVIPLLTLAFVGVLLLLKLYVKIRSKFNANVNCWFCNQNTRVPYLKFNSWTCPHCEQYNGFTKDGDYNREIFEQRDCSNISTNKNDYANNFSDLLSRPPPRNGFCDACNEAQRLKVEKLAQFEPRKESKYDAELKTYRAQLEEQYRLCATCDRHLKKVLREKKKMVLGSKFLDFIIKGAETLKQPHFLHIRHLYQLKWKRRLSVLVTIFAILNLYCLSTTLPALNRENLINTVGDTIGKYLFMMLSHSLAILRVITSYLEDITTHHLAVKIGLFIRTVFLMILYSFGLKLPNAIRCSFVPLYLLVCPFAILSLTFGYNIVDKFKLTRFTFLMVLWSAFAGGLVDDRFLLPQNVLLLLTSLVTIVFSATSKPDPSPKLHDTSANSYHKIYSEDYFSDEDTVSMLSQQLNNSSVSMCNGNLSNRSFCGAELNSSRLTKSPVTSSTFSLNNTTRNQMPPNSAFKSFHIGDTIPHRPQYPASLYNYGSATKSATKLYASNSHLPSRQPHSIFDSATNLARANTSFGGNHSFGEQRFPSFVAHEKSNENSFSPNSTRRMNGLNGYQNVFTAVTSPMQSPFSVSSSAVYQQRKTNLLSPSRFSTNCLLSPNTSTTSWLSGGYFNQASQPATLPQSNRLLMEHRKGLTDDNLSRASSQSSGFESQNDRLNVSRESSCGPAEPTDLLLHTAPNENDRSFQPINANDAVHKRKRATTVSRNFAQPLTVNCSPDIWKRKTVFERDTFNLRKINEELPRVRRGDLLKNWKQNHCIS